jgi:predicted ATPase
LVAWRLAEAERQPVLAVWEDLHWADRSTLELLSLVIGQGPTARILTLLTCRWAMRSHLTQLTLGRLSRSQGEAMIARLTGGKPPPAIPTTLQDSLMARLDRPGPARDLSQLDAVLGREVSYGVLRAVVPLDEATMQHGLARLVDAELLYQPGLPPRSRYLFKHALIQEPADQSLLKRTRRAYHRRIAQVLEEWFPETVETRPGLLDHH